MKAGLDLCLLPSARMSAALTAPGLCEKPSVQILARAMLMPKADRRCWKENDCCWHRIVQACADDGGGISKRLLAALRMVFSC